MILTPQDLSLIAYALKELGHKRAEQALDSRYIVGHTSGALAEEAEKCHTLSRIFYAVRPHTAYQLSLLS